jgi:hypothetical protein
MKYIAAGSAMNQLLEPGLSSPKDFVLLMDTN